MTPNLVAEIHQKAYRKIVAALQNVGPTIFQETYRNLNRAALETQAVWQGYVSGLPIPGTATRVNNSRYRESIVIDQIGPMMFEVGVRDDFAAEARALEKGREERDLKKEVSTFRNRRKGKKSTYAYIPFRHSVEEMQRHGVYGEAGTKEMDVARNLKKVSVTGKYRDKEGIERLTYNWKGGTKMFNTGEYKSKSGKMVKQMYTGMYRFETTVGKSKGSSEYITFRTLSTKSPPRSWIIPAKQGLGINLAAIVEREMMPKINRLVEQGIEADVTKFAQEKSE